MTIVLPLANLVQVTHANTLLSSILVYVIPHSNKYMSHLLNFMHIYYDTRSEPITVEVVITVV
jgi:hypothetical protein